MMSRPEESRNSQGQLNLDALSNQLMSVEDDARHLSKQLSQMGFEISTNKKMSCRSSREPKNTYHSEGRGLHHGHAPDPITPFRVHAPETEALYKNYDMLVGRLCRLESTVQGLKLSIVQAQAERDLSKEEKMMANEKLLQATEAYDKEIARLNCLVEQSRKQLSATEEAKREAEQTIKRLQRALEETTSSQSSVSLDIGELRSAKSKLQRRVAELRDELSRESSLRLSLEESHQTLLARIQQMEQIVQKERDEVKTLSTNCNQLKRESAKAWEEAKQDRELRMNAESQLLRLQNELDTRQKKILSLEEDKKLLMVELRKLQKQYMELNGQVDNMTSLINSKQIAFRQLEHENKCLFEAMKGTASQNAELMSKYEQELEQGLLQKAIKIQTEENMKETEEKLKKEVALRKQLEIRCEDLEQQLKNLKIELEQRQEAALVTTSDMASEMRSLKEKLNNMERENEKLLQDKENLLEEVNQAVDSMTEERAHLEEELQQQQVELQNMEQKLKHAEEENYRLLQRLAAFEDQQNSQKHVQQAMADMMEQKNKLAYDKGRLQSKVDQLQAELESLAHAQTDLTQAKRTVAALEAKIVKLQSELSASTSRVQRLETQLKQAQSGGDRKEKDFEMALKARDEAVKEAFHLQQLIEALQEKEKQRAASFEQSLLEVRQDNKKMATTLESVMQSHAKLQQTMESLQIELGRKDNTIAQLMHEKSLQEQNCKKLQRKLDLLQDKLVNLEAIESTELAPLRHALQESQEDNKKLAKNMESLIDSNTQLQDTVEELNDQLQQKTELIAKIKSSREQDMKQHEEDIKMFEGRLENLKQQLTKEREKSLKKTGKEILELRKQLEDAYGKNGDLSRTNTELRHRVTELEHQVKEMKDKVLSLKSQVEHLQKIRSKQEQTIQSLQGLRDQLNDLEKAKNDYMKKTKEQSKMIQTFMAQITDLQTEIKSLVRTQLDMSTLIQKQETELQQEKKYKDRLKKKYKNKEDGECLRRERQLDELRQKTEEKLKEANNESLQISASLQDAHEWFKSKFDHLQQELSSAKHPALEGKQHSEVSSEKAKEMIQTSRETISRLADYAELAQQKTQEQLHKIQQQLLQEKARAELSEKKLKQFQDASLRHTEDLAKELDYLKNHSWILTETS